MKIRSISNWASERFDQHHRFSASMSEITSPWVWIVGSFVYLGIISGSPKWGIVAVFSFGVIPSLSLLYLLRRGYVSDWRVTQRHERAIAISAVSFPIFCGAAAFAYWDAPTIFFSSSMAGTILLIVQSAVTLLLKWKISVHSSVGAMCSTFLITGHHAGAALSVLLVSFAAIGGWSRYRLKAHTLGQVVAGGILGALVGALFGSSFMS